MNNIGTGFDRQVRPEKTKKRKKRGLGVLVFLMLIIITVVCSVLSYNYVIQKQNSAGDEEEIVIDAEKGIEIDIPYGSTTSAIADILKEKDVIKYPSLFKLMSKINGYDGLYQGGTHIVNKGLDYEKLMKVLSGKPESVKVMIPEGKTYKEIKALLKARNLITSDKFDKIANEESFDYRFLKELSPRDNRLEGYLFPDTYEFDMKAGEKEIIRRMLENFNQKFTDDFYKRIDELNKTTAKGLNLTVDKIITLASLIEKEASDNEDRAMVAGVFYNRLKNKDAALKRLQSCATIQYIYLDKEVKTLSENDKKRIASGIIINDDTSFDDPYNTYKNEGLPPGPICSPSLSSIKAALYPEEHKYLYFVANGDGTHTYSTTYQQHLNAVNKKQKAQQNN